VSEDVEELPAATMRSRRSVATIAARNLADLLGIDLSQVAPDPADGRITREGVAIHVRGLLQPGEQPSSDPGPLSLPLLQEPSETIRLSGMRGTIAKRMHASLHQMAQLTLTMDADMTAVLADRAERKAAGTTPSVTDYVVAATARALILHPRLNAQVTDAGIALLPEVHVGLAVAVDNGLLVPVVRDAAHRDLADLAAETTRLAEAARNGSISPVELEGATFSVSALGAYGVDVFTPVINPPNAGILGVGRLRDDLIVVDGHVKTVKRLTLSLTWDHRVVDGVPAAEFCRTVVDLLADPTRLDRTSIDTV
jgi:pyruvate dehydrogenase E2 component (dihydrolipoamide acetyltransferase)